jgi:hypothetical protein
MSLVFVVLHVSIVSQIMLYYSWMTNEHAGVDSKVDSILIDVINYNNTSML